MNVRKIFYSLLVLLLAACATAAPTATPSQPALSQSFSSSGITLNYPDGWVTGTYNGNLAVANSQTALDNIGGMFVSGQAALTAEALPADDARSVASSENPTALQITNVTAQGLLEQFGVETSPVVEIRLNGRAAARTSLTLETGESIFITLDVGNGNFVNLIASAAVGELVQYEQTFLAIAGTVIYTPEAPAVTEMP